MRIILTAVLASFLLVGTIVTTTPSKATAKTDKYTCEFEVNDSIVIAEVSVKVTGNDNTVVTVEYFSEGYAENLGQYQELNGEVVPETKDEACQFAENHYGDRE